VPWSLSATIYLGLYHLDCTQLLWPV